MHVNPCLVFLKRVYLCWLIFYLHSASFQTVPVPRVLHDIGDLQVLQVIGEPLLLPDPYPYPIPITLSASIWSALSLLCRLDMRVLALLCL